MRIRLRSDFLFFYDRWSSPIWDMRMGGIIRQKELTMDGRRRAGYRFHCWLRSLDLDGESSPLPTES